MYRRGLIRRKYAQTQTGDKPTEWPVILKNVTAMKVKENHRAFLDGRRFERCNSWVHCVALCCGLFLRRALLRQGWKSYLKYLVRFIPCKFFKSFFWRGRAALDLHCCAVVSLVAVLTLSSCSAHRIEPVSPALEGRFLATGPAGKSLFWYNFSLSLKLLQKIKKTCHYTPPSKLAFPLGIC